MNRAQQRNACRSSHFFFRTQDVHPPSLDERHIKRKVEEEYEELSMNEIINGTTSDRFPGGLLGFINTYLDSLDLQKENRLAFDRYLNLIRDRASGSSLLSLCLPSGI